jgi:hypothetical protein
MSFMASPKYWWVPWLLGGAAVSLLFFVTSELKAKPAEKPPSLPQSVLDDLRRQAVKLAYPDRDTGGWDIWAYDPKVGAIYDKLVGNATPA